MKINKIALGLFSVGMAASLQATTLKPAAHLDNIKEAPKPITFADWQAEQKREKFADTTDQIVVTFDDLNEIMDIETYANFEDSGASLSSFSANEKLAITKGKKSLQKLSLLVGQPLKMQSRSRHNGLVFKLPKEFHVDEIDAMTGRMNALHNGANAEKDPKRWPMAQTQPWGIADTQADQVSDSGAGNMTVCIIDSGYDINNPDLAANNHSGTNDSGTGQWSTPGGSHGTHVAGTIAAVNNSQGVVGVMGGANVNLHIIKVFTESGWAYSSSLTNAIDDCKTAGSKVVNMSLGGSSSTTAESNAMDSFYNDGILLIAAAGNDGDATHSYPASYDSVVSVAAVDENNQHANFSQYTNQVELSGPGEAILSTVGVGDGRQGFITFNGSTTGDDRVNPQSRYIKQGSSFSISNINGTVNGDLAACSLSGSTYSCGNMTGKICIAERNDNQAGSNYPEINPAKACQDAGAAGIIVYSNSARPGLQNPFLVDENSNISVPTVSVNRTLGQSLVANAGSAATLEVRGGTDYAYYNGTSMATPHVAGVAALAWSNNINCSASEVRNALKQTALDLDSSGRDNRTGWGLVQTKAASDYMASNCTGGNNGGGNNGGGSGSEMQNGVAITGVSGSQGSETVYTLAVPAGASDLAFNLSGGTGDADLYVSFGSEPSTSSYDCRSWASGNTESCSFASPQEGTYYVKVHGYSAFSGASLTGSYTESNNGGGNNGGQGFSGSVTDVSASRRDWVHYTLDVPANMGSMVVSTTGGTGDADLYVRFGSQPTTSNYDCRPYESGNEETCTISNPAEGTWHISVRAYRAFSGLTLNYSVQP